MTVKDFLRIPEDILVMKGDSDDGSCKTIQRKGSKRGPRDRRIRRRNTAHKGVIGGHQAHKEARIRHKGKTAGKIEKYKKRIQAILKDQSA